MDATLQSKIVAALNNYKAILQLRAVPGTDILDANTKLSLAEVNDILKEIEFPAYRDEIFYRKLEDAWEVVKESRPDLFK